jgi:recombinational DNA repair protein (RecF pathway)
MSDDLEPCARCGRDDTPATWSPAFAEHLCPDCRMVRTDVALGQTDQAAAAARMQKGAA